MDLDRYVLREKIKTSLTEKKVLSVFPINQ